MALVGFTTATVILAYLALAVDDSRSAIPMLMWIALFGFEIGFWQVLVALIGGA